MSASTPNPTAMSSHLSHLAPVRLGLLFGLLTLIYGFGLGAAFGGFEDDLKGHLKTEGEAALQTEYGGDEAAMKKVTDKAWVYFKRSHLHANGLGTSALVLILLLSFLPTSAGFKRWVALASGLGGLGYSVYWLLAGMRAPGMGSTGAAKESLDWLAIPTSALCLLGLFAVAGATLKHVGRESAA